jgi:hypothetical protein
MTFLAPRNQVMSNRRDRSISPQRHDPWQRRADKPLPPGHARSRLEAKLLGASAASRECRLARRRSDGVSARDRRRGRGNAAASPEPRDLDRLALRRQIQCSTRERIHNPSWWCGSCVAACSACAAACQSAAGRYPVPRCQESRQPINGANLGVPVVNNFRKYPILHR